MRTTPPSHGTTRRSRAALASACLGLLAMAGASAPPARAQLTGASIRIGPVTYNHGIGVTTAYGLTVGVPFPILDVSGSIEYASKQVVVTAPLDCGTCHK